MKNPILKKLHLNENESSLILNSPQEFSEILNTEKINFDSESNGKYNFVLLFVKTLEELNKLAEISASSLNDDTYFWIAYPKKSSKKYKSDVNRDCGWEALGKMNFEPVTQIAIDEDWSALRFRKVEFIKKMIRKDALSEEGKKRISK